MVDAGQPWLHNLITVLSAPTVVLSEQDGQLRRSGAQGALHAHSRVLSQAVLEINGAEPVRRSARAWCRPAPPCSRPCRAETAADAADPASG